MKALKLTVIACSLAVCAGCTMAPKYERPAAPVAATFPTGEAYKDVMTTTAPLPDWKVFITNPKAKKVVEMALSCNSQYRKGQSCLWYSEICADAVRGCRSAGKCR